MNLYAISMLCCGLLFILMPVCAWFGHRSGRKIFNATHDAKDLSTGVVDAGILSLLGLLTAFTFSSAFSRYELRRHLIVDEVNAIGTAYLRVDMLPAADQPELRSKFREYTRSRFDLWELLPDHAAATAEYARQAAMQKAIWSGALAATQTGDDRDARKLLLPALNDMFDITTTRLIAVQSHPPLVIFLLLGGISLVAAWIVGFGMAKSSQMSFAHVFGFAAMVSLALVVILDIEFPRHGFVTLDNAHELFLDLEKSMR